MNKFISKKTNPFFIAEISANHEGSIKKAKKLIKSAKESGADAIKLQTYTADSITLKSNSKLFKIDKKKWKNQYLWNLYEKAHTPLNWHKELFNYCKKLGVICFSSPFDPKDVEFLEKLNCPIYKIASFELNHFPLLKKIAKTKKPIIMSTGTSTLKEIEKSFKFLRKNNSGEITLLYCVSNYPSKINDYNLKNINILKKKFKTIIGFSDHSNDDIVSFLAVNNGAQIIEKHITLNSKSIDASFSKNVDVLKDYINSLKSVSILNKRLKKYTLPKKNYSRKFKRSIFTKSIIEKGSVINEKNIKVIRPYDGIDASNYYKLIGKKVKKDLKKFYPLKWGDINFK